MISEQEVTTMLRVLDRISAQLGLDLTTDPEIREMEQSTDLTHLMDDIDEAELERHQPGAATAHDAGTMKD